MLAIKDIFEVMQQFLVLAEMPYCSNISYPFSGVGHQVDLQCHCTKNFGVFGQIYLYSRLFGMLLVCLIGSFAKVALICLVVWFATNVADNLLLLDFAVCPLQAILMFEWLLIFLIFPFEPVLFTGTEDSTRLT